MSALRRLLLPAPAKLRDDLLAAAPWIVGFTVLTALLEVAGLLMAFANMGEDAFGMLRVKRPPQDVVVVTVDRASYERRDLFNSRYPLPADALHRVIGAIALAQPRLIAVDFRTTDASYHDFKPDPAWPPIVWAQEAVPAAQDCIMVPDCAYRALPVLGGSGPTSDGPQACSDGGSCAAVAIRLPDRNGKGRQYTRTIEVNGLEDRPTFPWAIVETCAATLPTEPRCLAALDRARRDPGDQLILFDIPEPWPAIFTAGKVFDRSNDPAHRAAWRDDPSIHGRIVILGSTFDTLDVHRTPGAELPGVFLNAQIVENELGDHHISEVPFAGLLALDLFVGFALVYFAYRLPFGPAIGAGAALVAVIFLASFLTFQSLNIWLNFVPVVVGFGLHELTDNLREYMRLRRAENGAQRAEAARNPQRSAQSDSDARQPAPIHAEHLAAEANATNANVATASAATENSANANVATANVATANAATGSIATGSIATANAADANATPANETPERESDDTKAETASAATASAEPRVAGPETRPAATNAAPARASEAAESGPRVTPRETTPSLSEGT